MWIAFVLWKIDICYNDKSKTPLIYRVVNCFCSLKDWYLLQPFLWIFEGQERCELLLFFERLIFATTATLHTLASNQLWIAFVLWKIDICYNCITIVSYIASVVNCFCSLKDWYLLQQNNRFDFDVMRCELLLFFERLIFATTDLILKKLPDSCELLLFFERLIFATTSQSDIILAFPLWIAFVLWKIDICYNIIKN